MDAHAQARVAHRFTGIGWIDGLEAPNPESQGPNPKQTLVEHFALSQGSCAGVIACEIHGRTFESRIPNRESR